jgi:hypothetical protein
MNVLQIGNTSIRFEIDFSLLVFFHPHLVRKKPLAISFRAFVQFVILLARRGFRSGKLGFGHDYPSTMEKLKYFS